MAQTCDPQPAREIVHVLPLSAFILAGIATLRLIAVVRVRETSLDCGTT